MYALVHDDRAVKCHCISVRETVEELFDVCVEGKVRVVPIPDTIKDDGPAIAQYCQDHPGVPL